MAIWARFHSVSARAASSPLVSATSRASSSRSVAAATSPNRCTKRIARRFKATHSRAGSRSFLDTADLVVGAGVGVRIVADRRCRVYGDLAQKTAGQCLLERRETLILLHPGHPA